MSIDLPWRPCMLLKGNPGYCHAEIKVNLKSYISNPLKIYRWSHSSNSISTLGHPCWITWFFLVNNTLRLLRSSHSWLGKPLVWLVGYSCHNTSVIIACLPRLRAPFEDTVGKFLRMVCIFVFDIKNGMEPQSEWH